MTVKLTFWTLPTSVSEVAEPQSICFRLRNISSRGYPEPANSFSTDPLQLFSLLLSGEDEAGISAVYMEN